MNLIAQLEAEQIAALGTSLPDFKAGDTIRVGYKVTEGTRSRVQKAFVSLVRTAKASPARSQFAKFPLVKA